MSSISHPPPRAAQEQGLVSLLRLKEVWASLAITAMWIAVAVTAVWGSDFVGSSNDGNNTTIPSGIFVGLSRPSAPGRWRSTPSARDVRSFDCVCDQGCGGTQRGDPAILLSRGPGLLLW